MMAVAAFGERSLKPGIDAFNASVPTNFEESVVFSPFSFELDCCVFAEALDPIGRANISEKLSVMSDFTTAYYPILDEFEKTAASNDFVFLSARTIGVNDIPRVNAEFKKRLFELRMNSSISLPWPHKGAERWLKAKLDGWMEDFVMPVGKRNYYQYQIVDAAVVSTALLPDSDCTTAEGNFRKADGEIVKIPFLNFRARVDYLRTPEKTLMRIPLRGGAFLYVMMPEGDATLADVRKSITGDSIHPLTLEPLDPIVRGTGKGVCEISLPKMDFIATADFENGLEALGIPEKDILYLYPGLLSRYAHQSVRFVFDEGKISQDDKEVVGVATLKAMFNRPFVFFVYFPERNVIPVIGQFTGK